LIDCDLWVQKATLALIGPYLAPSFRDWLRVGEEIESGGHIELPESQYFVDGTALEHAAGADTHTELGAYLDRNGITAAVFNSGAATSIAGLSRPLLATEVARAVNEWTIDQWLVADGRLLGSIVVGLNDPRSAAEEIRRAAKDERMAQIVVAYPPRLLGDRSFHPVYEAACEVGLPIVLQSGGDYSGSNPGLAPVGFPTSLFEAFVAWEYGAQPHLISMIASGVFDRFPRLRLVLNGYGIAWLPSVLWRLDLEYRVGRVPIPAAMKRLPSEYVHEHVRFTTAQLEIPNDPEDLRRLMELVDGEQLLMFASGPLRGEAGSDLETLSALPFEWQHRLHENAVELYPRAASASAPSA
jgi:predicted TIM-barrel fold metal-dependent hydrolase